MQLRVAVVSPRQGDRTSEDRAIRDVFTAARLGYAGPLLVLLPGAGDHWSRDGARIQALAQEYDAHAIFEGVVRSICAYRMCGPEGIAAAAIHQRLATSAQAQRRETRGLVDDLLGEIDAGERTLRAHGRAVGVLVCGENNVLVNEQSQGNRCLGVRGHPGRDLFPDVDLVLNGAHTVMGNWSKLNARFAWLSTGGRIACHTTNNNRRAWRSALRVFHDGVQVASGDHVDPQAAPFGLRLVVDREHDAFRVVVMDLPARDAR